MHKFLGNNLNIKFNNINENINYHRLSDNQINNLLIDIFSEFSDLISNKDFSESLNKFLEDENIIIFIFKSVQKNIITINIKLNEIKKEENKINNNNINLKNKLIDTINNNKREYLKLLKEYEKEKIKYKEINNKNYDDDIIDKKNLLIELFEYIKNTKIKNKEDLDEKTFKKFIINSLFIDIKQKENYINDLINEIEKYDKENKELLYKIINKIKESNRIKKYMEERKIKENQNEIKKIKIIEKMKQNIITGRNKYNSRITINLFKNKKEIKYNDKNKIIENNLIFY